MVEEMRLDTPLTIEEVGLEPLDATAILVRVADMGSKLRVHECYSLLLGIADVEITRLPLAVCVGIWWNDHDMPETEIYIITSAEAAIRQREIYLALQKYLLPSLQGE